MKKGIEDKLLAAGTVAMAIMIVGILLFAYNQSTKQHRIMPIENQDEFRIFGIDFIRVSV